MLGLLSSVALGLGPSISRPPASLSRGQVCKGLAIGGAALLCPQLARAEDYTTLPSGLKYKVLKATTGRDPPKVGDLIAIRFKGSFEGRVFDDITVRRLPLSH